MPKIINNEFRVNTFVTGAQTNPHIISLNNGNFFVCWESYAQDGSTTGIYGQLFSENGNPLGDEFRINSYVTDNQVENRIAVLSNGNFVVIWSSENQDGSSIGVYGQLFDSTGTFIGNEFLVNTYTTNFQNNAQITALKNGNFAVTWVSNAQDGSLQGVYGQIFTNSGDRVGDEFRVNTYTTGYQLNQQMITLSDDNFLVAWESQTQVSSTSPEIYGQIFSNTGTPVGSEFRINTYITGLQYYVRLLALSNGNFVASWITNAQDGSDYGIFGQLFSNAGTPIGNEFQINTYTTGYQLFPVMAALSNDNFVITWKSNNQDGSSYGIYGQLFNNTGNRVGNEFRVNTYTTSYQNSAQITALSDGNFFVAWNSDQQDGSGSGVYGQLFNGTGNPLGNEFRISTYTTNEQAYSQLAMLNNGNIAAIWRSYGQDGDDYGVYGQLISPLTVNNLTQTDTYTEDTLKNLNDIVIAAAANSQATATLTLSEPMAGSLTTGTSGSLTSSYHAATGIWQASGNISDINTLLASLQFNPAPNYNANFAISGNITDVGGTIETGNIMLTGIAVNDAPVLTTNSTALSFTEGDAPTAIDSTLTISDIDNINLAGATIQITSNYQNGEDILGFVNQNGITGSFNPSTGLMLLLGTSSVTNYQTALRSVTYQNISPNPTITARTISFIVSDSSANSIVATRNITITAVNNAPVITTSNSSLNFTEGDTATAIDSALTVSDVDSPNLSGATVQITSNYQNGEDVLSFANQNGITGSFNAATGLLALSGTSSVANYQTALRSVTYQNTAVNPATAARMISFSVSDASSTSTVATRGITITAVNNAPIITTSNGSLSFTEGDTAKTIDSVLTVSDVDSPNLSGATIQITSNYQNGEDVLGFATQNGITGSFNTATGLLTLSGTSSITNYQTALRSVTYQNTAANPSTTARTISFTVSDGSSTSAIATRGITVTAVNNAPIITTSNGSLSFTEGDTAKVIDSALTVSDADNANLTGATIQITSNYQNGEDVLSFANQNGITGTFNATTGLLTLSGTSAIANYQTALRSITYQNTAANPSTTARTISFTVSDGSSTSAVVTRGITITAVNNAPVITTSNGSLSFTEGDAAKIIDSALTVSDVDSSNLTGASIQISNNYQNGADVLAFTNTSSITGVFSASNGLLTLTGTDSVVNYQTALRQVTYQNTSPNPSTVARSISFSVTDGASSSAVVTRNVNVVPVNNAPIIVTSSGSLSYSESAAATAIDTALTVSDADNINLSGATVQITSNYQNGEDILAFTNQSGITGTFNASTGLLTLSGTASVAAYQVALRQVTYQNTSPNPATLGRTISFTVSDATTSSAIATKSIAVNAINNAPVITISTSNLSYTEGATATAIDPTLTVSDADNANLLGATVQFTSNYQNGEDVLAFTNQNGITGTFTASTGSLTLSGTASVANYQTALRQVTYQNLSPNPSTAARTISFSVSDDAGSATVTKTINVIAVNNAPVITTNSNSLSYTEGSTATAVDATLTVSDVDSTNLSGATVQITGNYQNGEDILNFTDQNGITGTFTAATGLMTLSGTSSVADYQTALRSITYQNTSPNPTTIARSISFKVSDGNLTSTEVTRSISIVAVNNAPVITTSNGSLNFMEGDTAKAIDSAVTVSDVDNTNLTGATVQITHNYQNSEDVLSFTDQNGISGVFNASSGLMALSGTSSVANYQTALRSITYQNTSPNPATAARTISFSVSDGNATSVVATRGITITTVNQAPVLLNAILDQNITATEPFSFSLASDTFFDADGDAITLSAEQTDGRSLPNSIRFYPDEAKFNGTVSAAGTTHIRVWAQDPAMARVNTDFQLTATEPNFAPQQTSLFEPVATTKQTHTAAIAGGVTGGIVGLGALLAAGIGLFWYRRSAKQTPSSDMEMQVVDNPAEATTTAALAGKPSKKAKVCLNNEELSIVHSGRQLNS